MIAKLQYIQQILYTIIETKKDQIVKRTVKEVLSASDIYINHDTFEKLIRYEYNTPTLHESISNSTFTSTCNATIHGYNLGEYQTKEDAEKVIDVAKEAIKSVREKMEKDSIYQNLLSLQSQVEDLSTSLDKEMKARITRTILSNLEINS